MKYLFIFLALICMTSFLSCEKDPIIEEVEEVEESNSVGMSPFESDVLDMINQYRADGFVCGEDEMQAVPPVFWNDVLDKASELHAQDMVDNNFVSHVGSNGSFPVDRLEDVGYQYLYSGENVAKGPPTIEIVLEEFMNSPIHCSVLMGPHYTNVGIAKIEDVWVLNFAKPRY